MRNSRQQSRVVDLVAVQMENGQHGSVAHRVQELIDVPRGRQRPGFRLAISHHRSDDQFGIVEGGAESMRENIAEFSAFMNGSGRLGSAMTANSSGEGELLEELM